MNNGINTSQELLSQTISVVLIPTICVIKILLNFWSKN